MTIRVLLVDDQALVRDGLSALLAAAADIEVVGEASNGREAIRQAAALKPDVVLMDVRMPEMNGLEATGAIIGERAGGGDSGGRPGSDGSADGDGDGHPKVLMLTTFDLDEYVYEALSRGASGFLLKDASAEELMTAVRVIARGEALLAPSITRRLIADFSRGRRTARPRTNAADDLTPRELEVLRQIAKGLSNAEIAGELYLAEQTVKTHVGRILTKLHLRDRTQAVVFAYENGLVDQTR